MCAYHHRDPYKDFLILGEDPHSNSSWLSSDPHGSPVSLPSGSSEPAHYVLSSPGRCWAARIDHSLALCSGPSCSRLWAQSPHFCARLTVIRPCPSIPCPSLAEGLQWCLRGCLQVCSEFLAPCALTRGQIPSLSVCLPLAGAALVFPAPSGCSRFPLTVLCSYPSAAPSGFSLLPLPTPGSYFSLLLPLLVLIPSA